MTLARKTQQHPTAGRDPDFDAFYRVEFPSISVLAGTVAGDRSTGEDVAQEAMTVAADRWAEISRYDKPGAWVRRIAINLALTRKRRRQTETRLLGRFRSTEHTEDRHGDPEVWAAVEQLAPRQRAVIALHYLEDRPVAEIADILEITVSAATSNLHKARTNLASILGASS